MIHLELLFWILGGLMLYTYSGYPALLFFLSNFFPLPKKHVRDLPIITVIIPAYNEEKVIAKKIENTLKVNYPRDCVQTIIVSDASTDRTEAIALEYEREGVTLIVNEQRRGKTFGLNRAYKMARGEILVFTDANSIFEASAFRRMVGWFSDRRIGLVTGNTRYYAPGEEKNMVLAMGIYTRFEAWIKRLETRVGSCVGADGAIFALRKNLYRVLEDSDINDFVIPLNTIQQGSRAVFDPEIICFEMHDQSDKEEFSRQVRISTRTIRALIRYRALLNPFCYGLFSWMLFSHKVLRFFFPVFLVSCLCLNILLLGSDRFIYPIMLAVAAGMGSILLFTRKSRWSPLTFLRSFVYMNTAFLVAWMRVFSGERMVMWEKKG